MSQLKESIEKTVAYLRERYPADLPLLVDMEKKLDYLTSKSNKETDLKKSTEGSLT